MLSAATLHLGRHGTSNGLAKRREVQCSPGPSCGDLERITTVGRFHLPSYSSMVERPCYWSIGDLGSIPNKRATMVGVWSFPPFLQRGFEKLRAWGFPVVPVFNTAPFAVSLPPPIASFSAPLERSTNER